MIQKNELAKNALNKYCKKKIQNRLLRNMVENDSSRIETDTNDEEDLETIIVNDIKQEN